MKTITHGRHCTCSACAREDWTNPHLACCGMHGPDCPPIYAPLGPAGGLEGLNAVEQKELDALAAAVADAIDRALILEVADPTVRRLALIEAATRFGLKASF